MSQLQNTDWTSGLGSQLPNRRPAIVRWGKFAAAALVPALALWQPAFAQGQAVADITKFQKVVTGIRDAACPTPVAPNSTGTYNTSLQKAIGDLRAALQARVAEITANPNMTDEEKATLEQTYQPRIAALDPAAACRSSAAVTSAAQTVVRPPPLPHISPSATVSSTLVDFGTQVVGDTADGDFQVLSSSDSPVGMQVQIDSPQEKRPDGTIHESENFKLKIKADAGEESCQGIVKKEDKHCWAYLTFTPVSAGVKSAAVRVSFRSLTPEGSSRDSDAYETAVVTLNGNGTVENLAHMDAQHDNSHNPALRAVAGFDVSAASSSNTQQKAFVEANLDAPIGWNGYACQQKEGETRDKRNCTPRIDPLNHRLWAFFNPRITSTARNSNPLANLNVQGFSDLLSDTAKSADLVQGIDFTGGFEFLLLKPRTGVPFWSPYRNTHARVGIAFVVGGGFTTPFSVKASNPAVFQLTDALRQRFASSLPPADQFGKTNPPHTNIAFVLKERSRFFRKYYAGFRLKTYHFSQAAEGQCDADYDRPCYALHDGFPGIIDLTAGQDEQVTGGHLQKWVFRLDAVYPLPFANGFTFFGSVSSALDKNRTMDPLNLIPSATGINDPTVFFLPQNQPFRDIYRIGLGLDLVQVISHAAKKSGANEKQTAPPETPAPAAPAKN